MINGQDRLLLEKAFVELRRRAREGKTKACERKEAEKEEGVREEKA